MSDIEVHVEDRIATVTLNRPDRLNALSSQMQRDLIEIFDGFDYDDDVWAVILTGAGERAFCAGVDLNEVKNSSEPQRPMRGVNRNFFETLLECGKPTIAALRGWTVGGGLELAMACDIRIAAESTRLGLPEARRGMGANFGTQMMIRLIPRGVAYEMLYTGEPITADRAFQVGLVNRVVPDNELLESARALASTIAHNAPLTVRRYKAAINRGSDLPFSSAVRLDVGPNPYASADRLEGAAAFIEKRPPNWTAS